MLPLFAPTAPVAPSANSAEAPPGMVALKRLIWLYFWLLIFEGALRKWILPGLSNPLLVIRDPVVILIYVTAGMAGVFPRNGLIGFTIVLSVVSFLVSEAFGSGNLLVSLYGYRTSFLHLPLIFVLPAALDRKDVLKMIRYTLVIAIPMFALVLVQFRSSPEAWINNGAGAGVGAQLTVGFGKIRPPGTFSFTAGLVSFVCAAAAIAITAQMKKDLIQPRLTIAALLSVAGMVLISGSRSALGGIFLVVIGLGIVCAQKPQLASQGVRVIVALGAIYFVLSFLSEFRTGLEIHQSRIEDGGGLKDGIFFRVLDGLIEPFKAAADARFFGAGLGVGTNGASAFLTGHVNFALGEGDWGRTIREMGPILGFLHIGLRIAILIFIARRAFESLRHDNPLPLLLFASVFAELLNGQFGVPSLLGLTVFKSGLCLSTTHLDTLASTVPLDELADQSALFLPAAPGFRGRSVYAEQLHGDAEDPATQRFGP